MGEAPACGGSGAGGVGEITGERIFRRHRSRHRLSPPTPAVREGIQLTVYSLIFEGAKNRLWEFRDKAAGEAFIRELEQHQKAVPPEIVATAKLPPDAVVAKY